ncbi:hypothetical protein [Tahibacter amnicola]|uniref:Uncharacterized protein n=1 Tax=Tahibacter amnicola TaxID=2976241 RepID=A0ABY6B774_9GAMM|nr:hypothetical protein [Tahibacter amnicola]UXI65946.1 hypothetical protein N4264_14400 [Tahibacter amnicola]
MITNAAAGIVVATLQPCLQGVEIQVRTPAFDSLRCLPRFRADSGSHGLGPGAFRAGLAADDGKVVQPVDSGVAGTVTITMTVMITSPNGFSVSGIRFSDT